MPQDHVMPSCNSPVPGPQRPAAMPLARRVPACGRLALWAVLGWLSVSTAGCQCLCCGTNAWSRIIDCGVDHAVPFDCLYCSKLDLTRIGRPGGLPGRCCCRPTPCCQSGLVFAHRWNSPPPPASPGPAPYQGLESMPELPAAEPAPYFPPADEASPLFPKPEEPPAESEDPGVVRTHYVQPVREETGRTRVEPPFTLVPIEAIFGN